VDIHADALLQGRATNCGCAHFDRAHRGKRVCKPYQDLTGQQFQQYLVLERVPIDPRSGKTWWRCQCTCGHRTSHSQTRLVSGEVTQCQACSGQARGQVKLHRWYGAYFVLARVANTARGQSQYQCRCAVCERVQTVRGAQLLKGARCACGKRPGTASLPGSRVGRWQVLALAGKDKSNHRLCRCQCTCAAQTVRDVHAFSLMNGESQSCGCLQREAHAERRPQAETPPAAKARVTPAQLVGQRVGRWLVLAVAGRDKTKHPLCRCQCTCAAQTVRDVRAERLVNGASQSCGCLQREARAQQAQARERQGTRTDIVPIAARSEACVSSREAVAALAHVSPDTAATAVQVLDHGAPSLHQAGQGRLATGPVVPPGSPRAEDSSPHQDGPPAPVQSPCRGRTPEEIRRVDAALQSRGVTGRTLEAIRQLDAVLQVEGVALSANQIVRHLHGSKRDALKRLQEYRAMQDGDGTPGPTA
jgi:hypothetical protein